MLAPGVVGLNNIKANDYVNVVVQVQETKETQADLSRLTCCGEQTLNRVSLFRDFFLAAANTQRIRNPLIQTGM